MQTIDDAILPHHHAAATMWDRGGKHHDNVSFAVSAALKHAAQRLNARAGELILDVAIRMRGSWAISQGKSCIYGRVHNFGVLAGALALVGVALPGAARANAVLDWNVVGFEATVAGGENNVALSRTMAMVQLAVHDALNSLERRYEAYMYAADPPFKPPLDAATSATAADAAIAAAARDVLVSVIPEWGKPEQRTKARALIESTYAAALSKLPDGPPRNHGIAVGQAAAAAMILARKGDGASAQPQYAPGTAPGAWRPHPNPVPANPPIADAALAVGNWPALLPQWASWRLSP